MIEYFLLSCNICSLCNYSCTDSCLVISFPSRSHSFIRSQAGVTLTFYFQQVIWTSSTTSSPQPCHTRIRPQTPLGLTGNVAGVSTSNRRPWTVFAYCEVRNEVVGEGAESRASFTPQCQSWFLGEECGHTRPTFLCVHT